MYGGRSRIYVLFLSSCPSRVHPLFLEELIPGVYDHREMFLALGSSKEAVAVGEALHADACHSCVQFRHHQLRYLQHSLVVRSLSSCF